MDIFSILVILFVIISVAYVLQLNHYNNLNKDVIEKQNSDITFIKNYCNDLMDINKRITYLYNEMAKSISNLKINEGKVDAKEINDILLYHNGEKNKLNDIIKEFENKYEKR